VDAEDQRSPLVSVVIPCLNEAGNIERCVTAALHAIQGMGVEGEVVVADNDSEDDSAALAERAGARVVLERRRGYGSAYMAGFAASTGRYIVMADADLTTTSTTSPASSQRSRKARRWSSAIAWTTSSPARCRGCTATSATRS
jgi:GT2 family glycosyltransferase